MSRLLRVLVGLRTLAGLARGEGRRERIVPPGSPEPRAEAAVAVLLVLATLCSAAFVFVYAEDGLSSQTQWEGLTLAGALGCIAAALIIVAKHLVVSEHNEEDYPEPETPSEQLAVTQIVHEAGSRFTRKRLLGALGGLAGGGLGIALLTPAASLGPFLDSHRLLETPWRRGRRLVDSDGAPLNAADIEPEAFYTAYAEGSPHDLIGAPVVVVRLDPRDLRLPRARRAWAPQGIVAYSKVCTHAGCAVAMYRKPTFAPTEPRPALICPCHYSTFDPAQGGKVLFGPAGRDLPQLPLQIDAAGHLRAAGNLSGPPGPSWWGVRLWKARFQAK